MQILRPRDEARAAEEASGCGGNLPDPSKRTRTLRLFPAPSPWLLVEMNSVPPSVPLAVLACSLGAHKSGTSEWDASKPRTHPTQKHRRLPSSLLLVALDQYT